MQEELSRGPSFQPPNSLPDMSLDDAPQKANGLPPKSNAPGYDTAHREFPQLPSKLQPHSSTSSSAALAPSRAGTLSWQQRPSSRGSTGPRSRPLSVVATENSAAKSPRASVEPLLVSEEGMSRSQIAQSLGSKDPTWFKQTQDRGLGSAAFRRNQEGASDTVSMTGNMCLPGLSRDSSTEPEDRMSPPPESVRSKSPSREGSVRGYSESSHRPSSSASLSSLAGIRSPLPTIGRQRFEPPSSDTISSDGGDISSGARTLAMSPSQGRISPERVERPTSPTKGLGGFVQSAMLKRSDSVNKRWSAQAGPGLSRGNSVASSRSAYEGSRYPMGGITPLLESRPSSISRENSPVPNARPGSSHGNATITQGQKEPEGAGISTSLAGAKLESSKSEIFQPAKRESRSPPPGKDSEAEPVMSPPASPSKKWSPTKASWLENAINKPDSTKVKSPAPQQPAWISEINRTKQQRGSVDLSKGGGNFKEVTTGGLIRSPPPGAGYKLPSIGGLPGGFSAGVAMKPRSGSSDDVVAKSGSPEIVKRMDLSRTPSPSHKPADEPLDSEVRPSESNAKVLTNGASATSPSSDRAVPQAESHIKSPRSAQRKPETPPKKDFTSTLKSRHISGDSKPKEEPEFKNVFGRLKRTQTQNYKAPDELKDNILRGKAGLALTGGPKKSDRKDEFKESILEKKKGMVVPSASTRITSNSSKADDAPTPEAIAKRQGLTRSESLLSNGSSGEKEVMKPEALAKLQHLRDKPEPTSPEKQPIVQSRMQRDSGASGVFGGTFTSSLAGMLQRGPSPMASGINSSATPLPDIKADKELSTPKASDAEANSSGPQLTHATKARARGPKRRLPTTIKQEPLAELSQSEPNPASTNVVIGKRLSGQTTFAKAIPPLIANKPEPRPLSNITNNNNNNRKISQPNSPRKPSTNISQPQDPKNTSPITQTPIKGLQTNAPPVVNHKLTSPRNTKASLPALGSPPDTPLKRSTEQEQISSDSTLAQEIRKPELQEDDKASTSVKGAAAVWGQSSKPAQASQPRSPIKLPTREDEEAISKEAGLRTSESVGLGIEISFNRQGARSDRDLSSPLTKSPRSPPLPGKKPAAIAARVASITLPSTAIAQPNKSPLPRPSKATDLLAEIFDEPPSSKTQINVDSQAVFNSRSSADTSQKIKTLRKQISQVTDNGRSTPIPSHQEHILFEESLYVCIHVFGSPTGTRTTEVYLWCGDGASSHAIEDAQLFAKKVAKDNSGKLIVLYQGKETSNFFQALGGIVITRRGSSGLAESPLGPAEAYILCGRQHVGQIAFDEVDFNPGSLCKGFPYIISTRNGKLYLWKGSGSGADELGCARLIGMDLGLMGEIEEVDEGRELDAFWEIFPGGKRDPPAAKDDSARHWQMKPSCDNYTTRLFGVDVEMPRPKSSSSFMPWGRRGSALSNDANAPATAQIREISPFAQSDLVDDKIFVLDAFFEIFVYVFPLLISFGWMKVANPYDNSILTIRSLSPAPQHKSTESASFHAALMFAHEYGILAASAEDRPFVPISSVVVCTREEPGSGKGVEQIPEVLRRAFRKWNDDVVKKGCKVLSLSEALEATGA